MFEQDKYSFQTLTKGIFKLIVAFFLWLQNRMALIGSCSLRFVIFCCLSLL